MAAPSAHPRGPGGRGPGIGPLGGLWPPHGPPCGPICGALAPIDRGRLPQYKWDAGGRGPSRPPPLIAAVRLRPHGCCLPAAPRLRPAPRAPTVGVVGADAPPPGLTARRLPHLRGALPALPVGLRPVGRPSGGPPSAPPALWGLSARLPPGLPPARLRARGPRPAAGGYAPLGRQCRRAVRRACAPHLCTGQGIAGGRGGAGPPGWMVPPGHHPPRGDSAQPTRSNSIGLSKNCTTRNPPNKREGGG